VLNKELHEELPALYDSRIPFLISVLQTLFACESDFHGRLGEQKLELNSIVDELALEAQKGTFHINAKLAAGMYSLQSAATGLPATNSVGRLTGHLSALALQSGSSLQQHSSQQQLHAASLHKKPMTSYGQLPQTALESSGSIGLKSNDVNRDRMVGV
jgi:hypothetical protein